MIRLTAVIEIEGQAPRALTHESNARVITLGRDASADFQIPLSTISRQHAKLTSTDNTYVIEDLGSTHGTLVNGKKLDRGEKKVLRNGDIIELTKAKITASIDAEKVVAAEPGEGTQAIAARAVQNILGRIGEQQNDGPYFRVIAGPDEGARYMLSGTQTEWAMGRSKDCEIVLNDPNVSRRHAIVKKDWSGYAVQDLGSKNGILVNDKTIAKPRRLKDKDEITVGPVKLLFIDPDAELLAALKDVPGFQAEPEEPEVEGQHLGAPEGEGALPGEPSSPSPVSEPPVPDDPEADLAAMVDPELLSSPVAGGRLPFEWMVVGLVGLLVVGVVVVLLMILA